MFKRIERRQKRKEEEEELGINEEMKDIMGLQDTDSSESESDSDSDSDASGQAEGSDVGEARLKRKRGVADGDEGSDEEGDGEGSDVDEDASGGSGSDEEDEDEDAPVISIASALREPIYDLTSDSDTRACAVCPGKNLKIAEMVRVHEGSKVCTQMYLQRGHCEDKSSLLGSSAKVQTDTGAGLGGRSRR